MGVPTKTDCATIAPGISRSPEVQTSMIRNMILGSEGFVGRPLAAYLEGLGERVAYFDIKRSSAEDAREVRLALDSVDRVYFLAWDVGGSKYLYRQDVQIVQLDWNLKLLLNVMPQLQAARMPFLFVSSQLAEEYDTVYGVTKRLGEIWTHLLGGVRVRLWNVYGPSESPSGRSHVISDFVSQALSSGEIRMLTDGTERRQFIHVDDVCRALHVALSSGLSGVYDISSFEWITVMEVAQIISGYTGARIVPGDRPGNNPITPMQGKIPGWLPEVRLHDGLKRVVDLMKSES